MVAASNLFIMWMIGFFVYKAGHVIHVLFVVAIILTFFRILRGY
ncbi:MAG: lmo0937 family membrane protein [Cryomorphaceae bacterium]|nr:lmo0937 family membrane protein [Cryomorphaceae bacterium]